MGKKNLADINIKNTSILPSEDRAKPITIKRELDSEIISVKIKPSEMKKLLERKNSEVGDMAPLSTYFKHYLRTKTDIFN